jgi:NADH:ubiquinone oxidoreductase subunit 5 (subunit L)/multisubunit Na+/H+ antiporter MnhA subunit
MEGPTPVSSLLHAATLVMAGIYLLLSLNSVLSASSIVLTCAAILGTITALFAASTAIVQNDIKRIIAYSTCSQFGYLFASVGLSQSSSTILHLSSHAGFKALLFICAGGVIHSMKDQ